MTALSEIKFSCAPESQRARNGCVEWAVERKRACAVANSAEATFGMLHVAMIFDFLFTVNAPRSLRSIECCNCYA